MPELPEVETVCRGIRPHCENQSIHDCVIRTPKLRWPTPKNLSNLLKNKTIQQVSRRGKYLLFGFDHGTLLVHLGMTGVLRVVDHDTPIEKHDHADFILNSAILRFNDVRRFGAILWTEAPILDHNLIKPLGPEPLSADFTPETLEKACQNRQQAIKLVIMNSHIVVGVGNIYANEALFLSGIHPTTPAKPNRKFSNRD